MSDLTAERVRELFSYDEDTGDLVRKITTSSRAIAGTIAGSTRKDGYKIICIDGVCDNYVRRIVWLYHYGELPSYDIDHINHNPSDNKIDNLREVEHIDNLRNTSMHKHNTSGILGVSWNSGKKKWEAYISVRRRKINLGLHEEKSDAVHARKLAEKEYGFHENHGVAA